MKHKRVSKDKFKKKHKKEKLKKKEKKLKKHKKEKYKKQSSSSTTDSDSDSDKALKLGESKQKTVMHDLNFLDTVLSHSSLSSRDRRIIKPAQNILDKPGQSDRELNPYWKDGGSGLPETVSWYSHIYSFYYFYCIQKS